MVKRYTARKYKGGALLTEIDHIMKAMKGPSPRKQKVSKILHNVMKKEKYTLGGTTFYFRKDINESDDEEWESVNPDIDMFYRALKKMKNIDKLSSNPKKWNKSQIDDFKQYIDKELDSKMVMERTMSAERKKPPSSASQDMAWRALTSLSKTLGRKNKKKKKKKTKKPKKRGTTKTYF